MCLAEDRTEIATVVDHEVPLAFGGLDVDENTRNLCDRHNAIVTAEQFGHAKPTGGKGIDADGRPTSPDHPWNAQRSGMVRQPVGAGVKTLTSQVAGHRSPAAFTLGSVRK